MNRRDKSRYEALERRRDFLATRIRNYKGGDPNRDKAELHALNWALRLVEIADEEGLVGRLYADGRL